MRRSWQPASAFSRAGRSGGSQALQLPRASYSRGSSIYRLSPDRAQQKSENSAPAPLSPIEEVWRESGPPAPPSIKFLRKFNIPPLPRLRPAEVGKFRPGTAFSHRRGLEGVRPSSSPEHQILAGVQLIALGPAGALQKNGRYGTASKTRTKSTSK